jgi:dipeptidase E
MKLLLTSSGNTNKSIEQALLDLLAKPFNTSSLVFISTAANVEKDTSEWLDNDINNFKKLEFRTFDVVDFASDDESMWKPLFDSADILVFGGGNEKYLLEKISEVGLDKQLASLLQSKIYVGISAGSMVTSKILSLNDTGLLYYIEPNRGEQIDGLGYVDFEIRPHLNSEYFTQVRIDILRELSSKLNHQVYAIDDNSAIKVENGNVTVISQGEWTLLN